VFETSGECGAGGVRINGTKYFVLRYGRDASFSLIGHILTPGGIADQLSFRRAETQGISIGLKPNLATEPYSTCAYNTMFVTSK